MIFLDDDATNELTFDTALVCDCADDVPGLHTVRRPTSMRYVSSVASISCSRLRFDVNASAGARSFLRGRSVVPCRGRGARLASGLHALRVVLPGVANASAVRLAPPALQPRLLLSI